MKNAEAHLLGPGNRAFFENLPRRLYGPRYQPEQAPDGLPFFIVRNAVGRVVARSAVWTNPELVHNGSVPGLIGSFESENDLAAATAVLMAAEGAIRAHGAERIIGPMNGSTWAAYRVALSENEPCLFPLEPMNPGYYARLWEACGYVKLADYSSSSFPLSPHLFAGLDRTAAALRARGVTVADFRPAAAEEDLSTIYSLSLSGFNRNFVYAPFPRARFLEKYLPIASRMRAHDAAIARAATGEPLGFVFGFPNSFAPAGTEYVIKSAAVLPAARGWGLGGYLVKRMASLACADGFRLAYHALMHEANISNFFGRSVEAQTCRRYRLYVKELR